MRESQNCGDWKAPLEVIWSNPLCSIRATQATLHRMGSLSIWLLNISIDGDSTTLLGNLCQCLVTLTVKTVFPDVQREPPVFQFTPIASGPVTGHHREKPGSVFCAFSFHALTDIDTQWATLSSWWCPCSLQGGWARWPLKVPSNPNHPMILWLYDKIPPGAFSSPGWRVPALSAFPHRTDAPIP